ncbi:N-acetylglucosamine-6-phosphate deacetylase, partial [Francisella tularensis subsp. holarctica]|nr:N-acetylglucosamine-6-phosphate deacetylase [Francisella tularensis subsp. holarctica]
MQSYILKGGKIYIQNDFEAKDSVVKDNVISDIVDDANPAAFNLPIIELSGD